MDINNFNNNNDLFKEDGEISRNKIHIRKTQRNGRKCITTVEGLENDLDIKKITKALKRLFKCNGAVMKDDDKQDVIQLSGDQSNNVKDFLVIQEIVHEIDIVIH
jgi:translation initiation factor 1